MRKGKGKPSRKATLRRPRSHQVDEEAQRLLRRVLEPIGVVDRFEHDYGKDFRIELFEEEVATGKTFIVQLKGTETANRVRSGEYISFQMEVKHIAYYVDDVREPVYLVVVDIRADEAYWIFVQGYCENLNPKWRTQKTLAVHLPVEHRLADTKRLKASIEKALEHMTAKRPGRVQDALMKMKADLEKLDSRFVIKVSAKEGINHATALANEDVPFSVSFLGAKDAVQRVIRRLLDEGRRVTLADEDVTMTASGSELFRKIAAETTTLEMAASFPAEIQLFINVETDTPRFVGVCKGIMTGGRRRISFQQTPSEPIINVALAVLFEPSGGIVFEKDSTQLGFSIFRWAGKQISLLPYFDAVQLLVTHCTAGGKLGLDMYVDGNLAFKAIVVLPEVPEIKGLQTLVGALKLARDICRWANLNTVLPSDFPDSFTTEDLKALNDLRFLLDPTLAEDDYSNQVMHGTMLRSEAESSLAAEAPPFGRLVSFAAQQDYAVPFFSQILIIREFLVEVSAVRIEPSESELRRILQSSSDAVVDYRVVAENGARIRKRYAKIEVRPRAEGDGG